MKNFSNLYIFSFSAIMVIIVAALLSFVSEELNPLQERNVELEKKTDILRSVNKTEGMAEADSKDVFIENQFKEFIRESFLVNSKGELLEGNAFEVTKKLKAEYDKPVDERSLPIFVYKDENGNKKYIIPVRGKGLWGQIWGYVAINDDLNTIYGAVFDHAKETPGLGAEINQDWFMNEFKGKKLFDDNGNFISIEVVKGGGADPADPHAVDAISGGTITSKGLEDMLKDSLAPYVNYFEKLLGS
jgi:Na+-transporting NADH:ubiquinone oxidoreductase subunit C